MQKIKSVDTVTPIDAGGELGFRVRLVSNRGGILFEITTAVLGELLAEVAYQGGKVGRDYAYELMASVNQGEDRRRAEKP